jgi:2-polyprenyl-3-methyl-5-hydroxy-6-metoxy-1,4-benzoquinol methylase
MKCRHCSYDLQHTFVDLSSSPPSNAYLTKKTINEPEKWYPLKVLVCDKCWLVQTEDFVGASEMFSEDYAYFSSFSSTWLKHAEDYVENITSRFSINSESLVVEIAANDGYLLQYVKDKGIPCYGIEPTHSTAEAARNKGIEIIEDFFSVKKANELLRDGRQSDLIISNNVLAHVPDINDFVKGISILLKPNGIATFEFPHLLNLVELNQFDTIYHEHYSYLSLTAVQKIFKANGLLIFDIEELSTHGGSLRIYAQRSDLGLHIKSKAVITLKKKEDKLGMSDINFYKGFQRRIEKVKIEFLKFALQVKTEGKQIVGYGAAAKGNTMMNFSGVREDIVSYVVDKSPAKKGKFMPGSRVPIVDIKNILLTKPDYIIIFPWNLKDEIILQLEFIKEWGGEFVILIPELKII